MPIILKNNASSTLATAISASDTGLVVADGSRFPALGAGEYCYATLVSTGGTTEVVKITARASNSLTVVRAQDGSSAASFAAGALLEMRVNAASVRELHDEASEVSIADAGGYFTATNVEDALQEAYARVPAVNALDFGAVGDGVADDEAAITAAITASKRVMLGAGTYLLATKVGEIQSRQVQVLGIGDETRIHVDNADNIGFRLGAIGGNDSSGGARVTSLFQDMTFTTYTKTDTTPVRGIDAQSVNPINVERVRLYGLGPEAVTLRRLYYGSMRDTEFVHSGLRLQNVNNYLMSGGGFFGGATGLPSMATMFGSEYVCELVNDDTFRGPEGIKFEKVIWESLSVPIMISEVGNRLLFDACWFENLTGAHLFKLRQTRAVTFQECKFDLVYTNSGVLLAFDSSGPRVTAADVRESGRVVIRGGELRLKPISGTNPKFATVAGSEAPVIVFDGPTLTRGDLFADPTVFFDVKGIDLATDDGKTFYSQSLRANLDGARNSWMPDSQSSDWDFAAGANFLEKSGTTGLTITTTTTAGEFMTGTRGVKVTGFSSDGVERGISRNTGTNGDMLKTTTDGETFMFFIRLKVSQAVSLRIGIQGASLEYGKTPQHDVPANEWRDYFIKSPVADTYAQGRSFNPQLLIQITNNSGSSASLFLDRVDYQIITGDHHI